MAETSLRERKKRETFAALSQAARELVHERGLDGVTVDEIADAAGVSPRTFFNYFSSKEEAIVGVDGGVLTEMAEALRDRPAEENAVEALRAILLDRTDPTTILRKWRLRNELVRRYPALLPRYLAAMADVDIALATALADRLGVDPRTDPEPRILVASVLAGLRAGLAWWDESDRAEPLADVLDRAFSSVVPEPARKP
jgi:AcrR family transcriptional regulator